MKLLTIVAAFLSVFAARSQPSTGPVPLHKAHAALTHIIIHDIFSPPVSSRIYLYAHVVAYEVLVKSNNGYKSLHGQVPGFPLLDDPGSNISLPLAATYAFLLTGKRLVFSEAMMEDSLQAIIKPFRKVLNASDWRASLTYGESAADKILQWATDDHYATTRKLRRYSLLRREGTWIPTPPAYMSAIEPHWKLMRTVALDSASQFKPAPPIAFSRDKQSEFYKLAQHVYETTRTLTQEQKDIANFWDCNPFSVNVHGHMNFATKKLSPGGHWLSIAGIASKKIQADIVKTSAAYTLTAIALYDGFISCWDEKYRSHLIRPETYINAHIDESWKPLLQTPPFPEYTSGHSVISTAAAIVLTDFFGAEFPFLDTSEIPYGYKARTFSSFMEACNEAAISRLYGGIHYRQAIEQGQIQGSKVGQLVLQKISLTARGH